MANRVKSLIESIHQGGSCPRLKIDLTREGVVCPDFVCEKWGEELIIDLDPSYPLNLAFTAVGVEADLSFGGYVTRCKFPYASIYLIVDRNTGKGELFEENIPASVRQKRQFTPSPRPSPAKAAAAPTAKKRSSGESRRRRRRRPKEEETQTPAAEAEQEQAQEEQEAPKGPKLGLVAVEPAPEPAPDAEPEATDATVSEETQAQPEAAEAAPAAAPAQASDDDDDDDDAEEAAPDAERQSETEAQRRRSIFKVIDGGK